MIAVAAAANCSRKVARMEFPHEVMPYLLNLQSLLVENELHWCTDDHCILAFFLFLRENTSYTPMNIKE